MAVLSICTRSENKNGVFPVYIRISHKSKCGYIKTTFIVNKNGIKKTYSKSGTEKIEISDKRVLKECLILIDKYIGILNQNRIDVMTIPEIISILTGENEKEISFTDFSKKFIDNIINEGSEGTAANYRTALNSLKKFLNKENIYFSDITSKIISAWILNMKNSSRKKNMYPICLKKIFSSGMEYYNDYDRNLIKIPSNPFERVKIPRANTPEKRSLEIDFLKKLFFSEIDLSCPVPRIYATGRKEIGRDVSLLIFCLAGINSADLYDLKKDNLKNWKLCYNRKKTRDKRVEKAYLEVEVPECIRYLFKKYEGKNRLFYFSERYKSSVEFCRNINSGLKQIAEELGLPKITTYSLRHSWATIASNECGAHDDEVAFALNHASAHAVTRGYIRPDYTKIDRLNEKVIRCVFEKDIKKEPPFLEGDSIS